MKYLYIIVLFFIVITCSDNKNKKNILFVKPYSEYNSDSISYKQWYATAFLIPEDKIPVVKKIDEVEIFLRKSTQFLRDSLYIVLTEENIPVILDDKGNNMSNIIRNYLREGNINEYCEYNFYWYPGSLYMAEKYSFPPAYIDAYHGLILLNRKKGESFNKSISEFSLEYLNKDEQDLAIYCLIKAYQKGSISEAKILSQYFQEGKYLLKDETTAKGLNLIYENRPLIEFE